ncbi:MAG: tetratricopeptide repeat protein [Pseudohongiellaceae bacterium]
MSLVNDMLRDLDQRRKSPDSASASANLMPASDMPVEKKNRILLIAAAALLVVVAGLAYLWSQQTGLGEPRRLNIESPVASTVPAPAEQPSAEAQAESVESQGQQSAQQVAQGENQGEVQGRVQGQAEPNRPAGIDASDASAVQNEAAVTARPESVATANDTSVSSPAPAAAEASAASGEGPDVVALQQSLASAASAAPAVDSRQQPAQNEPDARSTDTLAANSTASAPRGVVNQPAPASVKNDAQMSADQQDTMAVQAALRMIADNNTSGAYAHLEQHILQNRYAHQARETYAKLLMNEGELLASYNLVESGLGLAPNHAGYKKVKARILIADGQLGNAVELLSKRAPSVKSDLEYHEILATAQLASRDYEGALITYTSLVQQDQSQGKWWYGYAAAQDSLGNLRAARQAYNRAVQQSSLSPNLRRRSQERLAALGE